MGEICIFYAAFFKNLIWQILSKYSCIYKQDRSMLHCVTTRLNTLHWRGGVTRSQYGVLQEKAGFFVAFAFFSTSDNFCGLLWDEKPNWPISVTLPQHFITFRHAIPVQVTKSFTAKSTSSRFVNFLWWFCPRNTDTSYIYASGTILKPTAGRK